MLKNKQANVDYEELLNYFNAEDIKYTNEDIIDDGVEGTEYTVSIRDYETYEQEYEEIIEKYNMEMIEDELTAYTDYGYITINHEDEYINIAVVVFREEYDDDEDEELDEGIIQIEDIENLPFQNIEIPEYNGKWSAVDKYTTPNCTYYLFENDEHGDEDIYIVAKIVHGKIVETYETYDDIETCLRDNDIITEDIIPIEKSNDVNDFDDLDYISTCHKAFMDAIKNKPLTGELKDLVSKLANTYSDIDEIINFSGSYDEPDAIEHPTTT